MILFLASFFANGSGETPMNYDKYHGHNNYWKTTPEIVICKEQTIFTREQVESAVKIWKKKVSKITERQRCNYEQEKGKIKILDGKLLPSNQWGYTAYLYSERLESGKTVKAFSSAVVQLKKSVESTNILVHELGHAFGIDHYDDTYDIMNSYAIYF